jgi:hypothetical protein
VFDSKGLRDECKADRRTLLQVRPCNALAYRACGILKAAMQEVQRRRDLISHRVLERPGQFGSSVGVGGRMGRREKEARRGGPVVFTIPWESRIVRNAAKYSPAFQH